MDAGEVLLFVTVYIIAAVMYIKASFYFAHFIESNPKNKKNIIKSICLSIFGIILITITTYIILK